MKLSCMSSLPCLMLFMVIIIIITTIIDFVLGNIELNPLKLLGKDMYYLARNECYLLWGFTLALNYADVYYR